MSKMLKLTSLVVGLAMVLSFVAVPASAATIDELMAQIATLTAQIAALKGGAVTTGTTFTRNLTVGSTGADVTALQQILIDGGYLDIASPTTYFGSMTKAALVKYQRENAISATGYFGPITRAFVNSSAVTTTTGGTTTTTTTGTSITTPGVEGSITVTVNPSPSSGLTVREGDTKIGVLGLKLEAKTSDIAIQRVKVDLGSSTIFYNKLFSRIYLLDGNTVLAESALNSSTVVKDGSTYYITLSGFNTVVSKDSTKVLTLALDAMSSIDSTYDANATYGLLIPADGVRGVDGASLSQTGPTAALSRRTVTIGASSLADSATLKISLNSASLAPQELVADQNTAGDEYDKLPLMVFDLKAEKDDVKVTDLVAGITRGGVTTTASGTTAYLYEGSTLVGSATVVGTTATAMTATFSDIDYIVPKDSTKVLTLKMDVVDAGAAVTTFIGDVTYGANVTAENTSGTAITETGTATGYTLSVLSSGLQISLASVPTISKDSVTSSTGISTTTVTATFNVTVKAMGNDIVLPTVASDTPMFAKTGATNSFEVYADGVASALTAYSTSTNYTIPSSCSVAGLTNGCTLAEGSEVTIPVTYTFLSRNAAGTAVTAGNYAVQLIKVNYGATVTTATFMSSINGWRSPATYLQ